MIRHATTDGKPLLILCPYLLIRWRLDKLGPVSLTQFKFGGNFISLSPRFQDSDRYKILYMARQPCCRGMCKNLLRSDSQQRSYGKAKFPSNLNCGKKSVSETGPWSIFCGRHFLNSAFLTFESKTIVFFLHWDPDRMAAISHTTFSNPFLWMKNLEDLYKFHSYLFAGIQSTISQHWFR